VSDQLSDEDIDALDTIATPMAAHGLMRIVAEVRRLRADLAMANSELTAAHASWQADVARLNAEVEQLRADLATSIDNREIEAERVVEARASLAAALVRVEAAEGRCGELMERVTELEAQAGEYWRDPHAIVTATASSCTDNGSGVCTSCSTVHHIAPTAIAYVGAFAGGTPATAPRTVTEAELCVMAASMITAVDEGYPARELRRILADLGVTVAAPRGAESTP
jgi:hypothetical protein